MSAVSRAVGRTLEEASADELARADAAAAEWWDAVLEWALPAGIAVVGLIGLAAGAALWAVMA